MFQNINLITSSVFIIIILWVLLLVYFYLKKKNKLAKKYSLFFQDNNISYSLLFLIISFFIVLIWIFDFKWGEKDQKNELSWIDIVFVLDVSKSMNVLDFKDESYSYSRLDIAKTMISEYILNNIENRFWLVVFAWDAISISPLTTDSDTFLTFLENVDYRNLSVQWSNFEKAIELWVNRFDDSDRAKVMIIISDWGDIDDKIDLSSIENSVKDKDINSFVFWVWTDEWWMIITWEDFSWRSIYQRYKWEFVISKLNEESLDKLANSLDWTYFRADSIEKIWNYTASLDKNIIEVVSTTRQKVDGTRYLWFISFIFFLIYLIYPIFKRKDENK